MTLLTIYARREPTTDTVALAYGVAHKKDTVFYRDATCTQPLGRKPWYQSGHPRRNTREVRLNCNTWQLKWAH